MEKIEQHAHIAKVLRMEGFVGGLLRDVEKLKGLAAQHGSKIREMNTNLSNTVSNAEFMAAMTATRFQQLNISKHMKESNKVPGGGEDPFDFGEDKESKEVKQLKTQILNLESELFNNNFKHNLEMKKLEHELKVSKKDHFELLNRIKALEKKFDNDDDTFKFQGSQSRGGQLIDGEAGFESETVASEVIPDEKTEDRISVFAPSTATSKPSSSYRPSIYKQDIGVRDASDDERGSGRPKPRRPTADQQPQLFNPSSLMSDPFRNNMEAKRDAEIKHTSSAMHFTDDDDSVPPRLVSAAQVAVDISYDNFMSMVQFVTSSLPSQYGSGSNAVLGPVSVERDVAAVEGNDAEASPRVTEVNVQARNQQLFRKFQSLHDVRAVANDFSTVYVNRAIHRLDDIAYDKFKDNVAAISHFSKVKRSMVNGETQTATARSGERRHGDSDGEVVDGDVPGRPGHKLKVKRSVKQRLQRAQEPQQQQQGDEGNYQHVTTVTFDPSSTMAADMSPLASPTTHLRLNDSWNEDELVDPINRVKAALQLSPTKLDQRSVMSGDEDSRASLNSPLVLPSLILDTRESSLTEMSLTETEKFQLFVNYQKACNETIRRLDDKYRQKVKGLEDKLAKVLSMSGDSKVPSKDEEALSPETGAGDARDLDHASRGEIIAKFNRKLKRLESEVNGTLEPIVHSLDALKATVEHLETEVQGHQHTAEEVRRVTHVISRMQGDISLSPVAAGKLDTALGSFEGSDLDGLVASEVAKKGAVGKKIADSTKGKEATILGDVEVEHLLRRLQEYSALYRDMLDKYHYIFAQHSLHAATQRQVSPSSKIRLASPPKGAAGGSSGNPFGTGGTREGEEWIRRKELQELMQRQEKQHVVEMGKVTAEVASLKAFLADSTAKQNRTIAAAAKRKSLSFSEKPSVFPDLSPRGDKKGTQSFKGTATLNSPSAPKGRKVQAAAEEKSDLASLPGPAAVLNAEGNLPLRNPSSSPDALLIVDMQYSRENLGDWAKRSIFGATPTPPVIERTASRGFSRNSNNRQQVVVPTGAKPVQMALGQFISEYQALEQLDMQESERIAEESKQAWNKDYSTRNNNSYFEKNNAAPLKVSEYHELQRTQGMLPDSVVVPNNTARGTPNIAGLEGFSGEIGHALHNHMFGGHLESHSSVFST